MTYLYDIRTGLWDAKGCDMPFVGPSRCNTHTHTHRAAHQQHIQIIHTYPVRRQRL